MLLIALITLVTSSFAESSDHCFESIVFNITILFIDNKIEVPGMSVCTNCGELKLSHRVCPVCGFYKKDQKVVEIKVKEESTEK